MRAFKKECRVHVWLPDVTFWVGPEQGGLGTPKARAIITSETISLMNQCMCLNDDLRQVTIQDMSQAIAHFGCLILLALMTENSSLEPLLKGLFAQIHVDLSWRGFGWNRTGDQRITQIYWVPHSSPLSYGDRCITENPSGPSISTIAEAQAELQWNGQDWQQHPSLCHQILACTFQHMQIEWMIIQKANTPILTDGLMNSMPFSNFTVCNEADWHEARMWQWKMVGMGLHRIKSTMDANGMTPGFADEVKI